MVNRARFPISHGFGCLKCHGSKLTTVGRTVGLDHQRLANTSTQSNGRSGGNGVRGVWRAGLRGAPWDTRSDPCPRKGEGCPWITIDPPRCPDGGSPLRAARRCPRSHQGCRCTREGRSPRRWLRSIASNALAVVLRPDRHRDAATLPKARAAAASNGSGSNTASVCCRRACRVERSTSSVATSGSTDSSASVTAVMIGSRGRSPGSNLLIRTSVLVPRRRPDPSSQR